MNVHFRLRTDKWQNSLVDLGMGGPVGSSSTLAATYHEIQTNGQSNLTTGRIAGQFFHWKNLM